jgi:MoaA/NifB/PqqE/SkfB family radical SAM enzyme
MVKQISLPADYEWSHPAGQKILRFSSADASSLEERIEVITDVVERAKKAPARNLVLQFDHPDWLEAAIAAEVPKVRFRLSCSGLELAEIHRCRTLIKRLGTTLVIDQSSESPIQDLQVLGSIGVPLEFSSSVILALDRDTLLELAERMLYGPFFKTPIQPFFDLFRLILHAESAPRISLWDIFSERVGLDYFVAESGQMSLAQRWIDTGHSFGQLGDMRREIESSEFFQEQRNYKQELFLSAGKCASCADFGFCEGFWRSLDPERDCAPLKALVGYLKDMRADLWESYTALSGEAKGQVQTAMGGKPSGADNTKRAKRSATVFVSNSCPNNCLFCAPSDSRSAENGAIDSEDIRKFIHRCAQEGVAYLSFSGAGEPTLNPMLPDLVRYSKSLGIEETTVFTNGAGLTPEYFQRLQQAGNDAFLVSLHGLEDVHNRVTGRSGSFDDARRAIEMIGKSDANLTVNTCMLRDNLAQLSEILSLSKRFGCQKHSLAFPEWSGNALRHRDALPTYREVKDALGRISIAEQPHLILDNVPRCMSPEELPHVVKSGETLYKDLASEERMSAAFNLGNNTYPAICDTRECSFRGPCIGVDKRYVEVFGHGELTVGPRTEANVSGEV